MLAAQWHLIDESYGWPALGFSAVWMTQFAKNSDESCRLAQPERLPRAPNARSGRS
jgi:hypothetical protein